MKCFVLIFFSLIVASYAFGSPSPSKLKIQVDKIRKEVSASFFKEQVGHRKTFTKTKFLCGDNKPKQDALMEGTLELFVRASDSISWCPFQLLKCDDDDAKKQLLSLTNGGIESELAKTFIDNMVALKIYGIGLGEPAIINEVKAAIPVLKKFKPRHFQFGYKASRSNEVVSVVDRSMTRPPSLPKISLLDMKSASPVDVLSVVANAKRSVELCKQKEKESFSILQILKQSAENLVRTMIINNSSSILIFSDGSATFYNSSCVIASGGVYAIPIRKASSLNKQHLRRNTESLTLISNSQSMLSFDKLSNDNSNAGGNGFGRCESSYHIEDELAVPPLGNTTGAATMAMLIHSMGGMLDTPFDAEIIAGLAAITFARLIAQQYQLHYASTTTSVDDNTTTTIPLNASIPPAAAVPVAAAATTLSIQLLTDSRALCRILQRDHDYISQDIVDKNYTNRLAIWGLYKQHYDALSSKCRDSKDQEETDIATAANNNNDDDRRTVATSTEDITIDCAIQWTAGHPERRSKPSSSCSVSQSSSSLSSSLLDLDSWTLRDKGMWIVDDLAARRCQEVNNSQNVDSCQIRTWLASNSNGLSSNRSIALSAIDLLKISTIL